LKASLPIWLDYMKQALEGIPQPWFQPPPGTDLVAMKIDGKTGKKAKPGQRDAVLEYYKRGDEPKADDASSTTVPFNPMMTP
jgi:penicillin-binding protein 1A